MKLKLSILAAVFAAGMTASFAFAHDPGKGRDDNDHGPKNACTEVHLRGTLAAQTLTVTVDGASRKLNVAPGTQVQVQLGGTGQTVRFNAEACQVTNGTASVLQVKHAEIQVRMPRPTPPTHPGTTQTGTTATTTTTH
ncbi:MAG TPA: hypothetical protein VFA56_14330 [Gaiellaceae bacterium]|nr:hypothetical protein [Gaiellaceae bacterium]